MTETCDGSNPFCPADDTPADCDDGNPCTQDSCDPIGGCQHDDAPPATQCKTAQKSLLLLKQDSGDPSKNKLIWKWIRGSSTTLAELQDPTSTAPYGLCIYDAGALLIADASVPPSASKWNALSKGFKFIDPTGADDGIQRVVLKSSDHDTAKALVKGKGAALPDVPLGSLNVPLTVQLINGATGACFEATYDTTDVFRNDTQQFKAKK